MAQTYSRVILFGSGRLNGRVIPVAAVASPGTPIHTATAGDAAFDEVYLWATNTDVVARRLTIEWGGVGDPADHIAHSLIIAPQSPPIPILTGQTINGGLLIRAFASVGNVINLSGFINHIE